MTWSRRGARKGARRLSERQHQRILAKWPRCWLAIPGRCTGKSTQVHHVIDAEDGGSDKDDNLRGVCEPCHTHHSARQSQKRSVAKQNEWKRRPEKHPGVLD